MSTTPVAEKLGIQTGDTVLLLHAPTGYANSLQPLPDDCTICESPEQHCDIVQVFIRDTAMFDDTVPSAITSTSQDGRLWITYPKKSSGVDSDLSRDVLADRMKSLGWRGARQIAIDDVWSAIWFRPK